MAVNRRRFVQTLSATSAGRLLLGPVGVGLSLGTHSAAADASQAKYISFITPTGHHPNWWARGTGSGYTLGSGTGGHLNPYKNKIAFVKGLESALSSSNGAHKFGYPIATSNRKGNGGSSKARSSGGISIDSHLINNWGGGAKQLVLAMAPRNDNRSRITWTAANRSIVPSTNARDVFDTLFGNLSPTSNGSSGDTLRANKLSILDGWVKDIRRLERSLSADHRGALDSHLTYLEELEKSLADTQEPSATCSRPTNDTFYTNNANFPTACEQMMSLTVLAFSCGSYRASSLCFSSTFSLLNHRSWAGTASMSHHAISHSNNGASDCLKIDKWYSKQMAFLLKQLERTSDGVGGNLLDSTLVYWASETGNWNSHTGTNIGVMIAGNYNNNFDMGKAYNATGSLGDILVEICKGLDVNQAFGGGNGLRQIRRT